MRKCCNIKEDKNMSEVKKATREGFGEEIVTLGKRIRILVR